MSSVHSVEARCGPRHHAQNQSTISAGARFMNLLGLPRPAPRFPGGGGLCRAGNARARAHLRVLSTGADNCYNRPAAGPL